MTAFPRVTAYRYAADHGLPCDLDSLLALGLAAARRGRWLGIGEYRVLEGNLWVHTWPAEVFEHVTLPRRAPCPGCGGPLPPGARMLCESCGTAWGGQQPSASYAEWRAEVPEPQQPQFCPPGSWAAAHHLPDAGRGLPRDAGRGEDGVPRDGDDIRYEPFPHGPGDLYDDEVIPPWCPLPRGDQALRDIGF